MPLLDRRLREIERLYRARYAAFIRVAFGVTGNADLAAEAVQQAFADAIRSRSQFRGDGPLEAWVWRAVLNAARKAAQGRPRLASLDELVDLAAVGLPPDEVVDLAPHLAALPDRQRLAIFLRYYADLDYRAIAAVLGVKVGTVSATIAAAHNSLRTMVEEVKAHG
jgi:RNA polymerase sigma-70 factor (ECF subfamily)